MRHAFYVGFIATLLLATTQLVPAAASPKAQVMVLGVSHLVARNDVHNSAFPDDPLSLRRQEQIVDVVRHLVRFHPTKVLIEANMHDPKFAARYAQYVTGHYILSANETNQFGFRLAKVAGDKAIYPIDTFGPTLLNDNSRIDAYLKANFSNVKSPAFDAMLARSNTLEQNSTYLNLLRYLNSDQAIRANASVYSVLDGMGRDADNAGASYVSQWYTRNCYIFSNILSVVRPGDRVVVIMGQGHEYLLREFVRLNPKLFDVNPLTYLD